MYLTLVKFSLIYQKAKISIKDFFSKCNQIRSFLRIWSQLLKKSLMEIFAFCAARSRAHQTTRRNFLE